MMHRSGSGVWSGIVAAVVMAALAVGPIRVETASAQAKGVEPPYFAIKGGKIITVSGGVIEIEIPPGWTPPQNADSLAPGYFKPLDNSYVDSITVSGQTIRLLLGAPPAAPFTNGSYFWVLYGVGGGNAYARPQTTPQDTVYFKVRSDPQLTGAPAPIAVLKAAL